MAPFQNIKKILIIRCGALGDLIYATSIIDALIAQYGNDIQIDWVNTPGTGKLFAKDSRVHKTFDLKHRKFPIWMSLQKKTIINASKNAPYDILINLEDNKYFDALSRAIHATHKIGSPYTTPIINPDVKHMVDIIKAIYAPCVTSDVLKNAMPKLYGEHFERLKVTYHLPEKYITVNPSNSHTNRSRINYRAWPLDYWKTLINTIDSKIPIVVLAGKDEVTALNALQPYPTNVINLSGKTPLPDLIGIINHAQALITTDTGPAHLASATNTPVYALIGPTPVENTGPYKTPFNEVHIISKHLTCSPCYKTPVMDACTENLCMTQITPKEVLHSLQTTIEKFKA